MTEPRQMPEICPFLVAASDPDSVLNYPAAENACVKLGKPLSVSPDYQANYCLRTRHWFCPVFTGSVKQPPVPICFEEQLLAEGVSSASPELALPITRFESLPARGVGRVRRSTPSVSRQERISAPPSPRSARRICDRPADRRRVVWQQSRLVCAVGDDAFRSFERRAGWIGDANADLDEYTRDHGYSVR